MSDPAPRSDAASRASSKGEATRARLVAATGDLLERQGYHATGLKQIVEESGAPKGVLYYHFPGGKDELAAAAVAERGARVAATIRRRLAERERPDEAVRHFVAGLAANLAAGGCRGGGPIATPALEASATSELLREACRDAYLAWERAFAERFEAAAIAPPRAAELATACVAAIEGAIILMRTRLSVEPLERVADLLAERIAQQLSEGG